jgi:ABC-type transport system involved in cytochrome c biogenesis permease subunit
MRSTAVELRRVNAVMPIPVADADKQSDNWKLLTRLLGGVGVPLSGGKAESPQDAWELYPTALAMAAMQSRVGGLPGDLPIAMYEEMKSAYRDQDTAAFNRAVAQYESYLAKSPPPLWNSWKVNLEAYRNSVSPYYLGLQVYVLAFLAAIFGWLFRYRPLNWAAFAIVLITFVLHTAAILLNIYVSGRPPVTNLHSAAVFIGWAAVIFGLVIEVIYRLGLGNIVASVAGFATLLIAYLLSAGGDTITVLQAVLDTQIWLATHVVCITLGYAATYVAGLFGLIYVLAGVCTRRLDEQARKELARMIYGVTCFAILFSFVGTVLGGLWADDSWGRFWGWDPKENGALIIVLWNALILHARWDKLVADRGLALLAIGGNIVTSWSFFGVNQLGIGLHSYGFTNGVVEALDVFVLYMLACVAFGLVPQRLWRSIALATDSRSAGWTNPQLTFALTVAFAVVNIGFAAKLAQLAYKAVA